MNNIVRSLIVAAVGLCFSVDCLADVYVRGYTRKNGTYVAGHYRSSPDSSRANNWSTYGNVNPYTGKVGTKRVPSEPGATSTYSGTAGHTTHDYGSTASTNSSNSNRQSSSSTPAPQVVNGGTTTTKYNDPFASRFVGVEAASQASTLPTVQNSWTPQEIAAGAIVPSTLPKQRNSNRFVQADYSTNQSSASNDAKNEALAPLWFLAGCVAMGIFIVVVKS